MKNMFKIAAGALAALAVFTGGLTVAAQSELALSARSSCLMEYQTGEILFAENETERLPIASMCKIMSLLLVFEHMETGALKADDVVTVSEDAAHMGGSQAFLEAGGQYPAGELLKSVIVASANDSTVALAEEVAGSEEAFVAEMNRRAGELGMENTNFTNCTGLPRPGQYSCARDVALMSRALFSHPGYFEYSRIWMDKIEHEGGRQTELTNTNKLVRFYKDCDGGKTGYTSEAGHCISATARRNEMRLIAVVIKEPDSQTRFEDVKTMFGYGFANYTAKKLVSAEQPLETPLSVVGGKEDAVSVIPAKDYFVFAKRGEDGDYATEILLPDCVKAPLKQGEEVGKIRVLSGQKVVAEVPLLSAQEVLPRSFGDSLGDIAQNWSL